jgi:transposase
VLGLSYVKVAQQLNVDPTTVSRTVQLFEETGTVYSIQGYHKNTWKKLSTVDEFTIMEAIVDNPSMYLHELPHLVLQKLALKYQYQLFVNFCKNRNFLEKRLTYRALQRSEELRAQYMSEISLYEPQTLVFVDETSSVKRCALR